MFVEHVVEDTDHDCVRTVGGKTRGLGPDEVYEDGLDDRDRRVVPPGRGGVGGLRLGLLGSKVDLLDRNGSPDTAGFDRPVRSSDVVGR